MFVVELAGVQAVVELAEEFVEQVWLGLAVPVAGGAAGVMVSAGVGRGTLRSQCPYWADGSQPPVFDMPVQDNGFLAARASDGCRSGEGFQSAGFGESGAVITDLGEHPVTGRHSQAGEAGDGGGVRVLVKMSGRRLGEFIGGDAGGVELTQQSRQLNTHRVLCDRWLVQVGGGEDLPEAFGVAVEIASATGLDQQSAQALWSREVPRALSGTNTGVIMRALVDGVIVDLPHRALQHSSGLMTAYPTLQRWCNPQHLGSGTRARRAIRACRRRLSRRYPYLLNARRAPATVPTWAAVPAPSMPGGHARDRRWHRRRRGCRSRRRCRWSRRC